MRLFALRNLTDRTVRPLDVADTPPQKARPEFETKAAYQKWCQDQGTDHLFLSPVEGVNPHQRVSATNPPSLMHGLVLEYDGVTVEKVTTPRGVVHNPAWAARTFSGGLRLWFEFERPISVSADTMAGHFIAIAFGELKAKLWAAGFAEGESKKLNQYYEVGEWVRFDEHVIPEDTLVGWMARAAAKVKWEQYGVELPMEVVRKRAEELYPNGWPGGWENFTEGARGVRFWESQADAMSVIVQKTGCVCFTGERSFMSWADIFGADWVRRQTDLAVGQAIKDLWWDPGANHYWRRKGDDIIEVVRTREDLKLHLTVKGVSDIIPKGENLSDQDRAIYAIQMTRSVDAVAPLIYRPQGIVSYNGKRTLNISRVRLLQPAEGQPAWGEGFPWLAAFLAEIFAEHDQLLRWNAWVAHFYQSAFNEQPTQGLACFLAGSRAVGKSFLGRAVLGQLMGGWRDAGKFVMGEDQFNSSLMDCPIWSIDDAVLGTHFRARQTFSLNLKNLVANREIRSRAMYREGTDIVWGGRVYVTLNCDAESAKLLPDLEASNEDKVVIFRASDRETNQTMPTDAEVLAELPHYAAWLRGFKCPDAIRDARFGVKAWHHPKMLELIEDQSQSSGALDILETWRKRHFENTSPSEYPYWCGSPADLMGTMLADDEIRPLAVGQFKNVNALGMYVGTILSRSHHPDWLARGKRRTNMRPIFVAHPKGHLPQELLDAEKSRKKA